MADFLDSIRELLARLSGPGKDVQRRLKALNAMLEDFLAAKRDNEDEIHALKQEVKSLEARAVQKKRELDQTQGDSKRIVGREIERVFREIDRLRGREEVVAGNLERIGLAIAKVNEAKAALQAGVSEEQFDEIAMELEELFSTLRSQDRAKSQLEREEYKAPVQEGIDVEERMKELQSPEGSSAILSPEAERRLRQLETE